MPIFSPCMAPFPFQQLSMRDDGTTPRSRLRSEGLWFLFVVLVVFGATFCFATTTSTSLTTHPARDKIMRAKFTRFREWARKNDIHISKLVDIVPTAPGISPSVVANKDIPVNHRVYGLPFEMMIWNGTTQTKGPFGWYKNWGHELEPLVLFFMYDIHNPNSKYKDYYAVWPSPTDPMYSPGYWQADEVEAKIPSWVFSAMMHNYTIATSFERLNSTLMAELPELFPKMASKLPKSVASSFNVQTFLEKHWKWELYRYLWFMVSQRLSPCPHGYNSASCILPGLELFRQENFRRDTLVPNQPRVDWKYASMPAARRYKKGEELFVCPGERVDNNVIFLTYGATLPNNPHTYVHVSPAQFQAESFLAKSSAVRDPSLEDQVLYTRRGKPVNLMHNARLARLRSVDLSPTAYDAYFRRRAALNADVELKAVLQASIKFDELVGDRSGVPMTFFERRLAELHSELDVINKHLVETGEFHPNEKFRFGYALLIDEFNLKLEAATWLDELRNYIQDNCRAPDPWDPRFY